MPLYDTNKIDTISTLPGAEYNQTGSGHNTLVTSSGQTPTFGTPSQYGKAVAQYSADGDYYLDSGSSANIYVVVKHDAREPLANLVAGVQFRFIPLAGNTAIDPTVNIAGLGAKVIKSKDGSSISIGDIVANELLELFYDGTNFRLISFETNGFQTGFEMLSMLSSAPTGWLFEEGQEISRFTFANLFNWANANSLINTEVNWQAGEFGLFSDGDGATTFRLPDLRGQFIRVQDNGAGVDPDAGAREGGDSAGSVQDEETKYSRFTQANIANVGGSSTVTVPENGQSTGLHVDANSISGAFNVRFANTEQGSETRPKNIYRKLMIKI